MGVQYITWNTYSVWKMSLDPSVLHYSMAEKCNSCSPGAVSRDQCPDMKPGTRIDCSNVNSNFNHNIDLCSNGHVLSKKNFKHLAGGIIGGDGFRTFFCFLAIIIFSCRSFCRCRRQVRRRPPAPRKSYAYGSTEVSNV